jgi:hypothetical protein
MERLQVRLDAARAAYPSHHHDLELCQLRRSSTMHGAPAEFMQSYPQVQALCWTLATSLIIHIQARLYDQLILLGYVGAQRTRF